MAQIKYHHHRHQGPRFVITSRTVSDIFGCSDSQSQTRFQ